MTQSTPVLRDRAAVDRDHLNLLAVFHFVGAGLALLALAFLVAHYFLFHTLFADPHFYRGPHGASGPPPAALLKIMTAFYVALGIWFVASAALNVAGGICLRARRQRTFCFVVGAINCLHVPLGTVLGVFTLVILSRDSVGELFATPAPPPS